MLPCLVFLIGEVKDETVDIILSRAANILDLCVEREVHEPVTTWFTYDSCMPSHQYPIIDGITIGFATPNNLNEYHGNNATQTYAQNAQYTSSITKLGINQDKSSPQTTRSS